MNDDDGPGRARPIVVALTLAAIIGLLTLIVTVRVQTARLVDAASLVKIGDTRAEVTRRLGRPDTLYFGGTDSGVCYGEFKSLRFGIEAQTSHMINRQFSTDFDEWPVHIRFDSTGVVDRIKRGDTVIEK
jgi:hypothetical protein